MASAYAGHAICKSASVESVDMGDLLDAINSLPDRAHCVPGGYPWTPEKDAALMAGWNIKPQRMVARVLGCTERTARKRYRELTDAVR